MQAHAPPPTPQRPYLSIRNATVGDFTEQLREMLSDADWLPACQHLDQLQELLKRLDSDPTSASEPPPPGLISLITAYVDFRQFRDQVAADLNLPDDQPLHVTPEEWLERRLHHYGEEETRLSFADYRLSAERFRIGG